MPVSLQTSCISWSGRCCGCEGVSFKAVHQSVLDRDDGESRAGSWGPAAVHSNTALMFGTSRWCPPVSANGCVKEISRVELATNQITGLYWCFILDLTNSHQHFIKTWRLDFDFIVQLVNVKKSEVINGLVHTSLGQVKYTKFFLYEYWLKQTSHLRSRANHTYTHDTATVNTHTICGLCRNETLRRSGRHRLLLLWNTWPWNTNWRAAWEINVRAASAEARTHV